MSWLGFIGLALAVGVLLRGWLAERFIYERFKFEMFEVENRDAVEEIIKRKGRNQ